MSGCLAADDSLAGRRAGVLVAPESDGLGDFAQSIARRLAEAGYVAFAVDYYGGGEILTKMDQVITRVGALRANLDGRGARAAAALAVLASQAECDAAKLAAIGYCFGGTVVLELARSGAHVKAVVGFHCGLATSRPQDAKQIKGSVLVCMDDGDPLVPPDQRLAFETERAAGGVDWRLNVYGGAGHSFASRGAEARESPGFGYHEPSDQRSWRAMVDLLDETFAS